MNAIELLKEQHKEVDMLFKEFERCDEEDIEERQELFEQIADRLAAHAEIEEKFFYPSVRVEPTEDQLKEAVQEHLGVKRLIAELLDLAAIDESFTSKMKELKEEVMHHVKEEEHDLFPKVRKLFSKDELEALGEQMENTFAELIEEEPRTQVPMQTEEPAPLD